MEQNRIIFQIYVNNKEYDVWSRPKHPHKPMNGEPETWWLYFSSRTPKGTEPPEDSEHWIPYHVSMKRNMWDISIESYQTTKVKWGDYSFRSGYRVKLFCNKKPIYSFGTFDLDFGMQKAAYLKTILCEHPFNFLDQESENGRKIYYYGMPATIRAKGEGEIGIIPDYSEIQKSDWWKEYIRRKSNADGKIDKEFDLMKKESDDEDKYSDYINWGDALSDGNIDWFRSLRE